MLLQPRYLTHSKRGRPQSKGLTLATVVLDCWWMLLDVASVVLRRWLLLWRNAPGKMQSLGQLLQGQPQTSPPVTPTNGEMFYPVTFPVLTLFMWLKMYLTSREWNE